MGQLIKQKANAICIPINISRLGRVDIPKQLDRFDRVKGLGNECVGTTILVININKVWC